jgi:lipopolysaccharide biosynthesis glycosyltransferase
MDLNLLIASDENFLPHAVVALTSACENNRRHRLRIFYLHFGLGEADLETARAHLQRHGAAVDFIRIDDAALRRYRFRPGLATPTYFRILCGDVLPPEVERVLYLDCDVICRAPLEETFTLDLNGCAVAAVRDSYVNESPWLGQINGFTGAQVREYFNSGVLLIDLARYRSNGVGKSVMALLDRFHADFRFAEQDALNVALAGRWRALPFKWNVQSYWYTRHFWEGSAGFPPGHREQVLAAIRDPAILHYTTPSKPWHPANAHPLKQEYLKYRQLTPYAE